MEDPKPFAVLMEHIEQRMLREILEDAWNRYIFKVFIRISEPNLSRESRVLKKIRIYEITLKVIKDHENFVNHVKNLIATNIDNSWGVLFEDIIQNYKTHKECITLAKRLQNYVINFILRSHEWFEYGRYHPNILNLCADNN